MFRRLYLPLQWISAGLLAFFLPFTSFPLISRLTGSSMVAPLSLLPMLGLVVLWLAPFLLRSGCLPPHARPLLYFALAALFSSAAAFFLILPTYKTSTLVNSEIKALLTLAIGIAFYLVVSGWFQNVERLRFLLRWVNWGGLLMIVWSFYQAVVFYFLRDYPGWVWEFQARISTSMLLYVQRVTGFAYEPSWLAHQLNMLYLPFWLAASVTGFTAHRFRLWKIHFEHILLLGGVGTLVLSVSRVGLLTFLLMVGFLLLLWNIRLVRWLQAKLGQAAVRGRSLDDLSAIKRQRAVRGWTAVVSTAVLLTVYAGLGLGTAYGLSRYDTRMEKLFDFSVLKEKSFMHYANQLVFAERLVFWQAGWEVFNDHPLIGVGLGNTGYYFPEKLSAFSLALNEIRTLLFRQTALPNSKSLWVRLFAETGIVGFAFFAAWCVVLWFSAQFLRSRSGSFSRMVGLGGSFALIGLLVEGFSLDTFALPYYWVSFGMITAACELERQSVRARFLFKQPK